MKLIRSIAAALTCAFVSASAFAAQNSYVLPTSGPVTPTAFATAINNGLLSLATCHSGATAPANGPGGAVQQYQCWFDTSGSPSVLLKYYDGTSWATLATLDTSSHAFVLQQTSSVRAVTGTTDAIADGDRGKLIDYNNSAGIAVTLARAGASSQFVSGWIVNVRNSASSGNVTITPTTSTIDGASSLTVRPGQTFAIRSDGTNYVTTLPQQPYDADLNCVAALSTTGLIARTGSGTCATRQVTAPAAGITVTNPAGTAGDVTLALANDLAAVEGLSGTGIAVRSATDTWLVRTIGGTANEITVANGDGVSGAPTISLPSALTFTGKTITGGTFASPSIGTPTITGSLAMSGSSSGTATITAQAAAGTPTLSLPTTTGTLASSASSPLALNATTGVLSINGAALTKTDDTNVTLTLGGSPTTALVNAASITAGWTGQLSVARGGTGIGSGTSGGVPYFSGSSSIASSGALAANAPVIGGGAGVAPSTVTAGTNGQLFLGVTSGAPQFASMSQDCTITNAGVITCTKTNNVSFGTAATVNTGTSGATIPLLNGNNTYSGTSTFTGALDAQKSVKFSTQTAPAQITSDKNDYNPSSAVCSTTATLLINSDAARNITGLAGGAAGCVTILVNNGSFTITLKEQSASSTAANRFNTGGDVALAANASVTLIYDGTASRWRMASPASAGGGGGTVTSAVIAGAGGLTTSGTCSITTSGTCTLSDPGGFLNKIRNGPLDVWQRGTSSLATSTSSPGSYTADGWQVQQATSAGTCARDTGAGNGKPLYSLKCTGNAGGSTSSNIFRQPIESYVAAPFAGQTITVQFWMKQDTGSSVTPKISTCYASATDNFTTCTSDLAATSLTSCATATWCQQSYTLTASSNAGNGYRIEIDCNTALAASKSCWLAAVDARVTPGVSTGVNSNPPPAEVRPMQAELAFSQRYYNAHVGSIYVTNGPANAYGGGWIALPRMRATPTVTVGTLISHNNDKIAAYTEKVDASGYRLMCQVFVSGDMEITANMTASAEL